MLRASTFLITAIVFASHAMAVEPVAQECRIAVEDVTAPVVAPVQAEKAKKTVVAKPADDQAPGLVTFVNKPLSGELNHSILELIKMMVPTRATGFSYKDMEGKDQGKIILGVELEDQYTIELIYASDFRKTNRFVLDKIELISPNGKDDDLSKSPLTATGELNTQAEIDAKDYPALAGRNFNLHVFSEIDGSIITELEKIGPRLELLDKDELRALTKVKNYRSVKAFLRFKAATKLMKKYATQGPFKQIYSYTIGFGIAYAIALAMPTQLKDLIASLDPKKHHEVIPTEHLPKTVRTELHALEANVDKNGIAQIDRKTYPALLTYLELKDVQSTTKAAK